MARRGKHGNRETDRDRQIGKAVANGSPRDKHGIKRSDSISETAPCMLEAVAVRGNSIIIN